MNLLKHFIPNTLFEGDSLYNHDIKIVEVLNTIKLIVDGTVQSCSADSNYARKKVWGKLAEVVNKEQHITNMLLLGMGAGTLLKSMHTKGKKNLHTVSVEIDPVIISLAHKYFDLDSIPNNRVIEADAYDVVMNPKAYNLETKFDCVLVDTYSGADFPAKLLSDPFYKNISQLLVEDGCLVVNRIINKNDPNTLVEYCELLSRDFRLKNIYKVKAQIVSDNYIFVSTKPPVRLTL